MKLDKYNQNNEYVSLLGDFRLKNSEITVKEYELYLEIILSESLSILEKEVRIISLFTSTAIEYVCKLTKDDFNYYRKKIKKLKFNSFYIRNSFELNGVKYKSNSSHNKVKINIKESIIIKELLYGSVFPFPTVIMAVFFRPENEMFDYSNSNILKRLELFKELSCEYVLPYLSYKI